MLLQLINKHRPLIQLQLSQDIEIKLPNFIGYQTKELMEKYEGKTVPHYVSEITVNASSFESSVDGTVKSLTYVINTYYHIFDVLWKISN